MISNKRGARRLEDAHEASASSPVPAADTLSRSSPRRCPGTDSPPKDRLLSSRDPEAASERMPPCPHPPTRHAFSRHWVRVLCLSGNRHTVSGGPTVRLTTASPRASWMRQTPGRRCVSFAVPFSFLPPAVCLHSASPCTTTPTIRNAGEAACAQCLPPARRCVPLHKGQLYLSTQHGKRGDCHISLLRPLIFSICGARDFVPFFTAFLVEFPSPGISKNSDPPAVLHDCSKLESRHMAHLP